MSITSLTVLHFRGCRKAIREGAYIGTPSVNIGSRQSGRLRPENVLDVGHNKNEICNAIKKCKEIRNNGVKFKNPYGDGKSAERIVSIIKSLDLSPAIIQKKITY
mgnify:CR=1 FL=1